MPTPFLNLAIASLLCMFNALAMAAPLKICFEDVPQRPWTMPDGTGLNFELLNRVEKLLGENFTYVSMPWKRCQEEVRSGEFDGIIGVADSAERRTYSEFPHLVNGNLDTSAILYEDQFNVYLRVGSDVAWDGKKLTAPNRPVAVQSGYLVVGAMLRERGFKINDGIKSAEDGLRFLADGMIDVAVLQSIETEYLLKQDPRFQGRIVAAPTPFAMLPLFLAINRSIYARDPKRIDAIWAGIRTVRNSAEYRKLLDSACREQTKLHCN